MNAKKTLNSMHKKTKLKNPMKIVALRKTNHKVRGYNEKKRNAIKMNNKQTNKNQSPEKGTKNRQCISNKAPN